MIMTEISDRTFRIEFFGLLSEKMAKILLRQMSSLNLSFTKEEEDLIEYFMRDISPVPISVHTERKVCIEKFCIDLRKLTKKDPEQLMVFEQAFKSSTSVLSSETQLHIRLLFNSVRQP